MPCPAASRLAFVLAFAMLGTGCGEEPSTAPAPTAEPAPAAGPASTAEAALAALGATGPLFPVEEGTRWTWRAAQGDRTWEVRARRLGGDVRDLGDRRVPFDFTYADLDDEMKTVMKSIHARAPEGPQEFHIDAFHFRVQHDPPVPILPLGVRVGDSWTWKGALMAQHGERTQLPGTTTLTAKPIEELDVGVGKVFALPVEEVAEGLRITRYFTPGYGMVRYQFAGVLDDELVRFELDLQSFTPAKK